jgi:hypothetical protein
VEIGNVNPVAWALRGDETSVKRQVKEQVNHQIVGRVRREFIKGWTTGILPFL